MLGRTGTGKSFLLNFLITNLQKYEPRTFIFDLGGSFENVTRLFGGSYVRVGIASPHFRINPFSLPPTKENLDLLALLVKVLLDASGRVELDPTIEHDLYQQIYLKRAPRAIYVSRKSSQGKFGTLWQSFQR